MKNKVNFKKLVYLVGTLLIICCSNIHAQPFKPDKQGFVTGPVFQQFIKAKGYQLVSAFDTASRKPLIIAARVMLDGKWIAIDTKGEVTTAGDISVIRPTTGGFAGYTGDSLPYDNYAENLSYKEVNINGKYGTADKQTGKTIIPAIYDGVSLFKDGLVETRQGEKYGLLRSTGETVQQPKYDQIQPTIFCYSKSTIYMVKKDGKCGLLNNKGQDIIPAIYDRVTECSGGSEDRCLIMVSLNGKHGLITMAGKVIAEPHYDLVTPLTYAGQLRVQVGTGADKKFGMIDSTGKMLLQPVYDDLTYSYGNKVITTVVLKEHQRCYGAADLKGNVILQPLYKSSVDFYHGIGIVNSHGKEGVIDIKGKMLLEPIYEHLYIDKVDNCLFAISAGKKGVFNFAGKPVLPIIYDNIIIGDLNSFAVEKDGSWSIGTIGGKQTKTLTYDKVTGAGKYLIVEKDGKSGVADTFGNLIFPVKYDKFFYSYNVVESGLAAVMLNGQRYFIDRYGNEYLKPN